MDLISRETLIEKLEEHIEYADYDYYQEEPFINLSWEMVENIVGTVPSAQQWIPCSERLPKNLRNYLTTLKDGDVEILEYNTRLREWNDMDGHIIRDSYVIAWMPLPEAYKGE